MQPAAIDMIMDDKRDMSQEEFLLAAAQHFACLTVEDFLQKFVIHPKICADIWNNVDNLPEHARPSDLLATLSQLTKQPTQVRCPIPLHRCKEFIDLISRDISDFVSSFQVLLLLIHSKNVKAHFPLARDGCCRSHTTRSSISIFIHLLLDGVY